MTLRVPGSRFQISFVALLLMSYAAAGPLAQDVPLEYQVKAAYLYNFVKYVEWPEPPPTLKICVAGQNPFGTVLTDLVRNERVRGMSIEAQVILEPQSDCHVVFVPKTANAAAYLRLASGAPILTVGEAPQFIEQGGLIRFRLDGGKVRFDINRSSAEKVRLRVSSRLLQLAKIVNVDGETP